MFVNKTSQGEQSLLETVVMTGILLFLAIEHVCVSKELVFQRTSEKCHCLGSLVYTLEVFSVNMPR